MANTKLIDCFPYFNEKELLELRIKLLYDHVDKFVITEANQTHSGLPKEYTCHQVLQNIDDPLNKIELIQVDYLGDPSITYDHWGRERRQRDAALQLFHTFDDDCLFYFGDCDEILDPTHIEWICQVARNNPNNILRLPLVLLNCRADLRVFNRDDTPMKWKCSYVASKKHLARYTPSQIRESSAMDATIETTELGRFIDFPDITITVNNIEVEFGWHFGWMGDNSRRQLKCKSYLHYYDHVPGSVAPLNSKGMMDYMESYVASEGSTDPLGRTDHVLKEYPVEKLPSIIWELPMVKQFLFTELEEESSELKTLVVLIGNARGGEKTWHSMYNNLLRPYNADLALCLGYDANKTHSLYSRAKYVWELPEYDNWEDYYTENLGDGPWKNAFMLGEQTGFSGLYGSPGSGGIVFAFRDYLLKNKKDILLQYDRIIITRTDHFYVKEHPVLPNDSFWVPTGESYGGVTDRHHIFPSSDIDIVLGILENYINTDDIVEDFVNDPPLNGEKCIKKYFNRMGYLNKVKEFNRVQFTVKTSEDTTRWSGGFGNTVPYNPDLFIKYNSEYDEAMRNITVDHSKIFN